LSGEATGASKSLNKTITELMTFLEKAEKRPVNGLREFLNEKITDLAVKWYRRGFNRGHREVAKQMGKGRVPRILRWEATREFYLDNERTVNLRSTLPKKYR
jgi:hypothetical protein